VRPGPIERASSTMDSEGQRSQFAESARIRQARHRQRTREAEGISISLATEVVHVASDVLSKRQMSRLTLSIAENIVDVLQSCPGPSSRRDVMEKVLGHNMVFPFLPSYYPRPEEALVVQQFVDGFKTEL
jgi:hypothetical protein